MRCDVELRQCKGLFATVQIFTFTIQIKRNEKYSHLSAGNSSGGSCC
jgi:hypothetical protein